MDVFVFPSIYEGLGNALIEAQTSGLPCIVSETVPKEAQISENYTYCSLKKKAEYWASQIMQFNLKYSDRTCGNWNAVNSGYDIHEIAKYLQNYYLKHTFI